MVSFIGWSVIPPESAHAQQAPTGISYQGLILDIPRLPAFGGYTSEGGSFIGGVVYITDVEWMPGSDGAGYFVITTSVAEQLGSNAFDFGLWVFSDEGQELAQIDVEALAGNPASDTGHLGAKNVEVRELGDDHIIIETYAYEGHLDPNGLFIYRIGGFAGASVVASTELPSGSGGLNEAITYYSDDYILAPKGGATANSQHVLYSVPSLNTVATFSGNPFAQDGEVRYSRAPSIGEYLFASRRESGGFEAPEAYRFTGQGISEVNADFSGNAFVHPDLVGEDIRTGGKWIITGTGSTQNPREKLALLVPGQNSLVVEKEFSLQSGPFANALVPGNVDRRLGAVSAAGDFVVVTVWDNDGTGSTETGFGTNRVFVFNYQTGSLVFSSVLDEHVRGGPAVGVPHPTTGTPLVLNPNSVDPVEAAAVAPNGMLAVQSSERVYLYRLEGFDGSGGSSGPGDGAPVDPNLIDPENKPTAPEEGSLADFESLLYFAGEYTNLLKFFFNPLTF